MKSLNFRKTALTPVGGFTPAKQGLRAGVGVVKNEPKKVKVNGKNSK